MSKDRFKELQENAEKYDGTDISIIETFVVIDMEAPILDDFFNQVNALRNSLSRIDELIDDVEHLQNTILALPIIPGAKEKLEEKMLEVKILGHQIRKGLKEMKHIRENQSSKTISQRIIQNQIDGMTKQFCVMMDKYYHSIINYREKCKERVQRQYQIAGFVKTDSEIEVMIENGRFTMYPEIIIATEQGKENLNLIELRHQEIIRVENSIRDLHDMMFDIANLIESQGEQINSIMDNVRLTESYVQTPDLIPIPAKKMSHCFPLKLSRKRFVLFLPRLFSSCI